MNSSSSIPYEIKRKTDSFNNGKLRERQISIDITPKKNSNPSSPSIERNIVIDIQKRTDFVNVQTNTPQYEPTTTIYRASPYRKDRLNYSEYTNPGRTPNSSNYYNSSANSNTNNSRTHKNRSVHLSSSTITELSENNYRTFDPITPKSSVSSRKRNQIPQTEPRPKLRALHHFTPPRYEPRPPTQGKAYISQLSEDSGSSVFIDSSMALLSEKEEEQENEEKYDSNEEIFPIKRGPKYFVNFMSSSDLTAFSEEQNSSSSSRHSSKNKSRNVNSASNYSYTNYSNTEENPEEDTYSYKSNHHSHRSRHDRHSYSHASHQSGHHNSQKSKSKHSTENTRSRRDQINEDEQLPRPEREYSDRDDMQTPFQPRFTIEGSRKSPPKTQPVKKTFKSRNIDLDGSNSENNITDPQDQQIRSNTQRVGRSPNEPKHHSHAKSNASSSQMARSERSHAHSRSSRKSEPYYIRMKFVSSEGLTDINERDVKKASFHKFSNVGDAFSFQDTTNYYATLKTANSEASSQKRSKGRNNENDIIEEEEESPDEENLHETDSKNKTKTKEEETNEIKKKNQDDEDDEPNFDFNDSKDEENPHKSSSKNKNNTQSNENEDEEESKGSQIKKRNITQNETNKEKELNDEEFQESVEIPPEIDERNINIEDKSKKSEKYQSTEKGLIEKVESKLNKQESGNNNASQPTKQQQPEQKSSGKYQQMQNGLIEKVEEGIKNKIKEKDIKVENEDKSDEENENNSRSEEEEHSHTEEQNSKSEEEEHSHTEEQNSKSEEEQSSRREPPSNNNSESEIDNLINGSGDDENNDIQLSGDPNSENNDE